MPDGKAPLSSFVHPINCNHNSHFSSHKPSSNIGNVPHSDLLGFALDLQMCYANEIDLRMCYVLALRMCYALDLHMCIAIKLTDPNLLVCTTISYKIVHVIKCSSSLSMWCHYSIAQCIHLLVLCLHSHDM